MTTATTSEFVEESNFLLFEKPEGDGELVSAKQLREFIGTPTSERTSLDVVVIAACTSEFIGKVLL